MKPSNHAPGGVWFDWGDFKADIHTFVRFLDDVLDVNIFPLEQNREASQNLRRLGLGVMGMADMLVKLGLRYDSPEGRDFVFKVMDTLREEAIKASEKLGEERGVYPVYDAEQTEIDVDDINPNWANPSFENDRIPHAPRRNVAVLTVAPTGTTSMLFGVSSGLEPIFSPFVWRKIGSEYRAMIHPLFAELLERSTLDSGIPPEYRSEDGGWDWDAVTEALQGNHGSVQGLEWVPQEIRDVFVCAHDVAPLDHVRMQGAVQRAFDNGGYAGNSLSKTINLPNSATVADVQAAYAEAYRTGCKGITVYRDGSRQFQVLNTSKEEAKGELPDEPVPHDAEREAQAWETTEALLREAAESGAWSDPEYLEFKAAVEAAQETPEWLAGYRQGFAEGKVNGRADAADAQRAQEDAQAEWYERGYKEGLAKANAAEVRPVFPFKRPERLVGTTDAAKVSKMCPDGRIEAHTYLVTVNRSAVQGPGFPQGPVEVVLTSGKAGDETNADAEALGRVVSIALQYGVPAEAIIKTLRGINGGLSGRYAKRMVTSKADLIAVGLEQALEDAELRESALPAEVTPELMNSLERLFPRVEESLPTTSEREGFITVEVPKPRSSLGDCPECGGDLIRRDGCKQCVNQCGYSACG